MKKIYLILILALISFVGFTQKNNLLLVHPTQYNLELFTYLIDNKIINIDSLQITGIYHKDENYDYSKSQTFIRANNLAIELVEIGGELTPNSLYKKNSCSNSYIELFKSSNGVLFFGGPDLPPSVYGEPMSLLTRVSDPYRHYFELSFLFHLLGGMQNPNFNALLKQNPDYVIYGICLGMQTINVAAGGTMIQDIPSEVYQHKTVEQVLNSAKTIQHRNYNKNIENDKALFSGSFHPIKILNPKQLINSEKVETTPLVYSNHHQAIEKTGKNIQIIATSVDRKIIEAISHKKYPNVIGVQFHPEGIYLHNQQLQYKTDPNKTPKSGKQILKENNSYQFHLDFWKTFSEKFN